MPRATPPNPRTGWAVWGAMLLMIGCGGRSELDGGARQSLPKEASVAGAAAGVGGTGSGARAGGGGRVGSGGDAGATGCAGSVRGLVVDDGACFSGWIEQYGTDQTDVATDVVVDMQGFLYVVGLTGGELAGVPNAGSVDAFVAKLSPEDGSRIWTVQFGTPLEDVAQALVVDSAGELVVLGRTGGELYGPALGGDDLFVVKLSASDGSLLWSTQVGSSDSDYAGDVAVDPSGDVLVAGGIWGVGETDMLVLKLDGKAGGPQWSVRLGTPRLDSANGIASDRSGNVFVAGSASLDLFGDSVGDADSAVLKLSGSDGSPIWTTKFGSAYRDFAAAIAIDAQGDAIVAGEVSGELARPALGGAYDAYAAKLDGAQGGLVWLSQFGRDTSDHVKALALDGDGGAYVAGNYTAELVDQYETQNFFLSQVDAQGSVHSSVSLGAEGDDQVSGMCLGASGAVFMAGTSNGDMDGDGDSGTWDIVVTKLER